jgi:hypothetical protein
VDGLDPKPYLRLDDPRDETMSPVISVDAELFPDLDLDLADIAIVLPLSPPL